MNDKVLPTIKGNHILWFCKIRKIPEFIWSSNLQKEVISSENAAFHNFVEFEVVGFTLDLKDYG